LTTPNRKRLLYLALRNLEKRWDRSVRDWSKEVQRPSSRSKTERRSAAGTCLPRWRALVGFESVR
jgi:hypothetical protein